MSSPRITRIERIVAEAIRSGTGGWRPSALESAILRHETTMTLSIRRSVLSLALVVCVAGTLGAQEQRRPLDHSVYDGWNRISARAISNDGQWVLYRLTPGLGDSRLLVRNIRSGSEIEIPRGASPEFASDSRFVVFEIEPSDSIVKAMRMEDTRDADLPKDSLGILDLAGGNVTRVARVRSFALPDRAGGWVAYLHEEPRAESEDSSAKGARVGSGETAKTTTMRKKRELSS